MKVHVDSKTKEIEKRDMIWAAWKQNYKRFNNISCKQKDQICYERNVMDNQNILVYLPFHSGQYIADL